MSKLGLAEHRTRFRGLICAAAVCAMCCAAAQGEEAEPPINFMPGSVVLGGLKFVRPDVWCIGGTRLQNPTDQARDLTFAALFKENRYVQFTSTNWLPPHSKLMVRVPMRSGKIAGDKSTPVEAMASFPETPELPLKRDEGLFMLNLTRPGTAIMRDSGRGELVVPEAATALRTSDRLPLRMAHLSERSLPARFIGYHALDSFCIGKDHPDLDSAQFEALRHWLLAGGHLWIMAEQVEPQFLAQLLGDDWTGHVVDHVKLNRIHITGGNDKGEPIELEVPVDMVRLYAPEWEVIHQVRGWPASVYRQVGLGWVLLTTVGPRAWFDYEMVPDPKKVGTRPIAQINLVEMEKAYEPLRDLRRFFNRRIVEPPLPKDELARYAQKEVGFTTLSRRPIALALGGFTLALLACAAVLARMGHLEHTAWVSVILALLTAATLAGMGEMQRQSVPLTVSEASIVRVVPRQQHGIVDGALAIYSPVADKGPLTGVKGGVVWPDMERTQGSDLVRLRWNDLDKWVWDGVNLPPGAFLTARTRHLVPLDEPVDVTLTFDADGAVGQLRTGDFGKMQDLLLMAGAGHAVPRQVGEGRIVVTREDQMPVGDYVSSRASVQARRQGLYRKMFGPFGQEDKHRQPLKLDRLTLFAWSSRLDLGYSLPQEHDSKSSTLVMLPVTMLPVEPGTRVTVPEAFIGFSPVRGPEGIGNTTMYDKKRSTWIDINRPGTVVLAYQLPKEVLPLAIDGGQWTIDIDAPGRTFEAFYYQGDKAVELMRDESVIRSRTINLAEHGSAMSVDDDGIVLLGLRIGQSPVTTAQWKIRKVNLYLTGTVGPSPSQPPDASGN